MSRRIRKVWCWSILLLVIIVGVFVCGCSGKSSVTGPELAKPVNPGVSELGLFRGLVWNDNPDEPIMDGEDEERNVDITNVVYDSSFPGFRGRVKQYGVPPGANYNYAYTVATWAADEGDFNSIWFKVLYLDALGWENQSAAFDLGYTNPPSIYGDTDLPF